MIQYLANYKSPRKCLRLCLSPDVPDVSETMSKASHLTDSGLIMERARASSSLTGVAGVDAMAGGGNMFAVQSYVARIAPVATTMATLRSFAALGSERQNLLLDDEPMDDIVLPERHLVSHYVCAIW